MRDCLAKHSAATKDQPAKRVVRICSRASCSREIFTNETLVSRLTQDIAEEHHDVNVFSLKPCHLEIASASVDKGCGVQEAACRTGMSLNIVTCDDAENDLALHK